MSIALLIVLLIFFEDRNLFIDSVPFYLFVFSFISFLKMTAPRNRRRKKLFFISNYIILVRNPQGGKYYWFD